MPAATSRRVNSHLSSFIFYVYYISESGVMCGRSSGAGGVAGGWHEGARGQRDAEKPGGRYMAEVHLFIDFFLPLMVISGVCISMVARVARGVAAWRLRAEVGTRSGAAQRTLQAARQHAGLRALRLVLSANLQTEVVLFLDFQFHFETF